MKLIVSTSKNTIIGTLEGTPEAHNPDMLYLDPPEGFDITSINDYTLVDGVLTIDPAAALQRAKLQKIRAIRTHFDAIMQGIKATVAAYEIQTWDTQREELV
ncbi:MAG: hypothetical protein IE928_11140, partial [Gammaproteobacteria bacterium]|nr:hypothetical protein [Gammaproteobacteria bacterium]